MAEVEADGLSSHLEALREANRGWAITVWKSGEWKVWKTLDAKYAETDPEWLCTLSGDDVGKDVGELSGW